jgi:hypothetical protein
MSRLVSRVGGLEHKKAMANLLRHTKKWIN